MVVYDTYAWIEYFRGSEKGMVVKEKLREGGYTPSIVLAELSRKYLCEGVGIDEIRSRLLFIEVKTKIVHVDLEIALESAKTYMELYRIAKENKLRTPSLADAIVYTIAVMLNEELITGDRLFKNLPLVIYIGD